jgi:hypothetical protein
MKMPAMSRRTALAATAIVVGLAVIALALVGGSGSSGGGGVASSKGKAIEPVAPINPDDKDSRDPRDDKGDVIDPTDPFSTSFGHKGVRKVNIRIEGNGAVWARLNYRGRQSDQRTVNGSFSQTRKVKGGSPLASVAIQLPPGELPGAASRATCRIIIDGVEVSEKSTSEPGAVALCLG